jgi:hypothetical protein
VLSHGCASAEDPTQIVLILSYLECILYYFVGCNCIVFSYRVIEPYCVPSFIVLMIQSCFGVFQQSLMTGLIFAKLSRPKQRAATIMFSRNAVVCKRDMKYCLLFRVGDMRKSHIIGTSIRAVMVKDRSDANSAFSYSFILNIEQDNYRCSCYRTSSRAFIWNVYAIVLLVLAQDDAASYLHYIFI